MKRAILLLLAAATPSLAEPATYQLTPAERDAVLNAASHAPADPAPVLEKRDRAVHGEVGVAVGTGGYSEAFGTVVAPLGDSGFASLSYDVGRDPRAGRVRLR